MVLLVLGTRPLSNALSIQSPANQLTCNDALVLETAALITLSENILIDTLLLLSTVPVVFTVEGFTKFTTSIPWMAEMQDDLTVEVKQRSFAHLHVCPADTVIIPCRMDASATPACALSAALQSCGLCIPLQSVPWHLVADGCFLEEAWLRTRGALELRAHC